MNIIEATLISERENKAIFRKIWYEFDYKVKRVLVIDGKWYDQNFNQWCPSITEDISADDWAIY